MLRLPRLLALVLLPACVATPGTFTPTRFESGTYPYAVYYEGGAPARLVGDGWRLDNYATRKNVRGDDLYVLKTGSDYEVVRHYDLNDDGQPEQNKSEPFYDLRLEHRELDAELVVRTVPLSQHDEKKALRVMADRYVQAASGAGAVAVRFGSEGPVGSVERRFASRILGTQECTVSGKPAFVVDFEVANVDQLQLSPSARWLRTRLAVVRTGMTKSAATGVTRIQLPVLMLVALHAEPGDFDALAGDFDALLGNIAVGPSRDAIPGQGGHTCVASQASTAPQEAPAIAPPAPEPAPVDPQAEPAPAAPGT